MHGVPLLIGNHTANTVVAISKDISGRDVQFLGIRCGKFATIAKLLLTIKRWGGSTVAKVFATTISAIPLAVRADYWKGLGTTGAAQIAAAIADGTNPVAALDAGVDFLIDIGRHNLRGSEKLTVEVTSTSALSSESVKVLAMNCPPGGVECPLEFNQAECSQPINSPSISECWLYQIDGQTLDPQAQVDGYLVTTVEKEGGKGSDSCQVADLFAATSAAGNFEAGESEVAALVYEDLSGMKAENPTIAFAGTMTKVKALVIERFVDVPRARSDRAQVASDQNSRIARLEQAAPAVANSLRLTKGLPAAGTVR